MNLIIDIGNTLQKIAVFHNNECVYGQSFPCITKEIITPVFNQFAIEYSIISSVAEIDAEITTFLQAHTKYIHYSHETRLPVTILYKSVKTLGLDRIANAVGAATLFPNRNLLSIQVGTCLVLDFVNEQNEYLGGSIAPGMNMRFEALHEKTQKLPLLREPLENSGLFGSDTESSICCGVINGMCYEIDGFIEDYKANYKNLIVLLTGGDASFLQTFIKNTIFAAPNVVLKGLNEIIKYNV